MKVPRHLRALSLMFVIFVFDMVSKEVAVAEIDATSPVAVFPGLELSEVQNRGVAFGLLADQQEFVFALVVVALAGLVFYYIRHLEDRFLWITVGLLLGGAAGNIVDRVRLGYVRDFIDPSHWPAFNFADVAITTGVLVLAIGMGLTSAHEQRNE